MVGSSSSRGKSGLIASFKPPYCIILTINIHCEGRLTLYCYEILEMASVANKNTLVRIVPVNNNIKRQGEYISILLLTIFWGIANTNYLLANSLYESNGLISKVLELDLSCIVVQGLGNYLLNLEYNIVWW